MIGSTSGKPVHAPTHALPFIVILLSIGFMLLAGAASAVTFRVTSVYVSPTKFSPNGDRVGDTTRIYWRTNLYSKVKITITKSGRLVKTLQNWRYYSAGRRSIIWNGKDGLARYVGAGTYAANVYALTRSGRRAYPYPARTYVAVAFVPSAVLANQSGEPTSVLPPCDALASGISRLASRTHYRVRVAAPNGTTVGESRLMSDATGHIPLTTLEYDLGLPEGTAVLPGARSVVSGLYGVKILTDSGSLLKTYGITVDGNRPYAYASDAAGNVSNSFLPGTGVVYVRGKNLPAGQQVDVYVASDSYSWAPGTSLSDVSGGKDTLTTDSNGSLLDPVWTNPSPVGAYDLVVDLNRNGVYDRGEPADGAMPVGFMVQTAAGNTDIVEQIACDMNRAYKSTFNATESVYAYINPRTITNFMAGGRSVDRYVCPHRGDWVAGMPLYDVSGGIEIDRPERGCTNMGRVLVWPAPLTVGVYDIVIDVNKNKQYDPGIDFLDNINDEGEDVGGFTVRAAGPVPVVTISSPSENETITARHCDVSGSISDRTVRTANLYVNGRYHSAMSVSAYGYFSATVMLRKGANDIMVQATNRYGTGYDDVLVYGDFESAVMRVTLTWNDPWAQVGTSDVDLHVYQPDISEPWDSHVSFMRQGDVLNPVDGVGWQDVDDQFGYGPESYIVNPGCANEGRYRILVNYWDAHQNDSNGGLPGGTVWPVDCKLKIVMNEDSPLETIRIVGVHRMTTPGYFDDTNPDAPSSCIWRALTITMPGGTITEGW